jgi:hypothetical protein
VRPQVASLEERLIEVSAARHAVEARAAEAEAAAAGADSAVAPLRAELAAQAARIAELDVIRADKARTASTSCQAP